MARPSKFSHDQLLDAARAAIARHGTNTTIGQVSEEIGAPVGSIYHRFASREELFVSLWLRAIHRFHVGLLAAAEIDDARQALAASAVHIPRYCREHPDEALAMTLYRQKVLVTTAPASLLADVRTVNDDVIAAMTALCARRYGTATDHRLILVAMAVQQCPYGLVRPHVGADVPLWLDDVVLASSLAILALGDRASAEQQRAWSPRLSDRTHGGPPTGSGPERRHHPEALQGGRTADQRPDRPGTEPGPQPHDEDHGQVDTDDPRDIT
jgi:AcrR family transcriptional regulator